MLENCLLVFEDFCEENFNDKKFSKLANEGDISVIYVKHKMFEENEWSRTIYLNTTQIFFSNHHETHSKNKIIGRQLNNTQFLMESYELAIRK